ncbi:MAG: hypothetical protein O3B13_12435 [Planctomycetota bacterium]|nr:hypothetical protein [Planctomycetota bacterium]MDA1163903.1 hypothetical protein [Planctomycetota bacterium]
MSKRQSRNRQQRQKSQGRQTTPCNVSERRRDSGGRPAGAFRQRGAQSGQRSNLFYAHDEWYEPSDSDVIQLYRKDPGVGFMHPVSLEEVIDRVEQLPARYRQNVEVIELSSMTRKRSLFPCYGMQWGPNVYLYPIEESLVETYTRPPRPEQVIEAKMFGGVWTQDGKLWKLSWTEHALRDFYLNNVLIHEIGHVNDTRNRNQNARERYADWFAIEYGYRASRGRR